MTDSLLKFRGDFMIDGLQSESLKVFMNEIASEFGIQDYENSDKSRILPYFHGAVGGTTSKLCNLLGQKIITETAPEDVRALMDRYDLHVEPEVLKKSEEYR